MLHQAIHARGTPDGDNQDIGIDIGRQKANHNLEAILNTPSKIADKAVV